jgi:predicted metal-dependent hydrolase
MITPDNIIRSNRKTISVQVDCFGVVTVRAPMRCGEERIFAFLQEKEAWILRQKEKMAGAGMRLPGENLDGYSFLLLGKTCCILLTESRFIRFDGTENCIYLPQKNARTRLQKWLKENALRIFTDVTAQWANVMQTSYQSVAISSAKTRWGVCSGDNQLRFSFRLLYAPKEVIEYVVVHELAHVRHKNHGKGFWAEVGKYIPDYKQRRKWLKDHGYLMEIF